MKEEKRFKIQCPFCGHIKYISQGYLRDKVLGRGTPYFFQQTCHKCGSYIGKWKAQQAYDTSRTIELTYLSRTHLDNWYATLYMNPPHTKFTTTDNRWGVKPRTLNVSTTA